MKKVKSFFLAALCLLFIFNMSDFDTWADLGGHSNFVKAAATPSDSEETIEPDATPADAMPNPNAMDDRERSKGDPITIYNILKVAGVKADKQKGSESFSQALQHNMDQTNFTAKDHYYREGLNLHIRKKEF